MNKLPFHVVIVISSLLLLSACTRNEDKGFSIDERFLDKDCTSEVNDYIVRLWRAATAGSALPDLVSIRATKGRLIAYNPKECYGVALVELEVRIHIPQKMRENPRLYFNQIGRTLDEEHWNQLLSYADHPPKVTRLLGLLKIDKKEKHFFDSRQEKSDAYQTAKIIMAKMYFGDCVYVGNFTNRFLYGESIENIQRNFSNDTEAWGKNISRSSADQGKLYPYLSSDLINLDKAKKGSSANSSPFYSYHPKTFVKFDEKELERRIIEKLDPNGRTHATPEQMRRVEIPITIEYAEGKSVSFMYEDIDVIEPSGDRMERIDVLRGTGKTSVILHGTWMNKNVFLDAAKWNQWLDKNSPNDEAGLITHPDLLRGNVTVNIPPFGYSNGRKLIWHEFEKGSYYILGMNNKILAINSIGIEIKENASRRTGAALFSPDLKQVYAQVYEISCEFPIGHFDDVASECVELRKEYYRILDKVLKSQSAIAGNPLTTLPSNSPASGNSTDVAGRLNFITELFYWGSAVVGPAPRGANQGNIVSIMQIQPKTIRLGLHVKKIQVQSIVGNSYKTSFIFSVTQGSSSEDYEGVGEIVLNDDGSLARLTIDRNLGGRLNRWIGDANTLTFQDFRGGSSQPSFSTVLQRTR